MKGAFLLVFTSSYAALAQSGPCALPEPGPGRTLFVQNCTVCHGTQGKGGGVLAKALNLSPPDLTTLAARTKGVFPSAHVLSMLREGGGETAEGDKAMPVWAKIFSHECGEDYGKRAVAEIERYIEAIQQR